ncbi:MAG: prenyltransferase/squalene oxidase repeat-containing protein [Gemmataceae bacterium]
MNRRSFLQRSLGALTGLSAAGLVLRSAAQDRDSDLVRDMITPATQEAIDDGLRFLASQQAANGAFGTGGYAGNTGVTGLGGLAFMASGSQPGRGPYGRNITQALEYVLSNEDRGVRGFLSSPRGAGHGAMYGHGFATLFLAEAHGMISSPELRRRVRDTLGNAVQLIVDSQNREGGWRYQPRSADADLSVTICQIMALRAARNAGVFVPRNTADNCIKYVKECQDRFSGGFRYQRGHGPVGFARTAAGVTALYSAGVYKGEEVEKGLDYMIKNKPGDGRGGGIFGEAEFHYYYGHYYAAQAMWIAGGRYFREWYPAIRNELLGRRQGDGSWFDGRTCRHYCTAMALIILQIPNNYLPIMHR